MVPNRKIVIWLLSCLALFNLLSGVVWLEVMVVFPLARASNQHGQIADVEERLRRVNEAQAVYQAEMTDFSFYCVATTLAINFWGILIALGFILSPSSGWAKVRQ